MTIRNPDEVRESYVSAMGKDFGHAFYRLNCKLTELHLVWVQYRRLFGTDEETVNLLNRCGGLFFRVVQDELLDSVLLGISRMTDPPATGKRKNLTIQSLPELVPNTTVKLEAERLVDIAVLGASFAREHRNKRIAHQDHGYTMEQTVVQLPGVSREKIEEMLSHLRNAMNFLDAHYRETTVFYQDSFGGGGAEVLVSKLKQLEMQRLPRAAI